MRKFMNDRLKAKGKWQKTKVQSLWIIVLCSMFFVFSSCSTKKETTSLRNLSANHIINEVENNQFDFDNLEATIRVNLKGDNIPGLKGKLRMQNDSVIWISLSLKIGIEVGRIMITNDSIKFVNRNTRTYISENIDFLDSILPINASFQFFQDLLVGNISSIIYSDKFKSTIENNTYKLENNKSKLITNNVWVIPETYRISQYDIQENLIKTKVEIKYDDFHDIGGKLIPSKIIFALSSKHNIYLEINYSDISTGEKMEFPFNISKKYDKTYLW